MGAPLATERQVEFLYHLARQIRALSSPRRMLIIDQRYGQPLEEPMMAEAFQVIELLKEIQAGKRSVDELPPKAAA